MSDEDLVEGDIKTVRKDAKSLGFEKELDSFAKTKGIDLGQAPPIKKKEAKNTSSSKAVSKEKCKHDHN
eukprot:12357923-Ditylum_brightwellii.AAC.1